jgi:hypothetical protein
MNYVLHRTQAYTEAQVHSTPIVVSIVVVNVMDCIVLSKKKPSVALRRFIINPFDHITRARND